ncbi:MAG: hypothetical protein ACXAC7_05485 [Candidatus Hodarchaeales archaeon]|jgi:GNAT superfamily N-acetyltransferase
MTQELKKTVVYYNRDSHELLDDWYSVFCQSLIEQDLPLFPKENLKKNISTQREDTKSEGFVGYINNKPAGRMVTYLPLEDNTHMVWMSMYIVPEMRGKGLELEFLKEAYKIGRKENRTILSSGTEHKEINEFWENLGAKSGLTERIFRLYVNTVEKEKITETLAEVEKKTPEIDLLFYKNDIPEDIIESVAELQTSVGKVLYDNLKLQEQEITEWIITPDRIKDNLSKNKEQNHSYWILIALDKTNNMLVGYTEIWRQDYLDLVINQEMTGVITGYHSKGIAKRLKYQMLIYILEITGVKFIQTGNANINAPILHINKQMGYKLFREGYDWRISLDEIEKKINQRNS